MKSLRLRTHLYRLSFFFVLGYGLLYFTYKWVNPDHAESDFFKYYPMIQHPLNFHISQSPWIYRQISPLIAHCIWRLHIYYPLLIEFHNPLYDQRLFFAAILTNFTGVLLSAVISAAFLDRWLNYQSDVIPLFAGLLCFFSFFLQETTINAGADGITWALLAICYLCYKQKRLFSFCALLTLSILQREILPLVFVVFAATNLLRDWRHSRPRSRFQGVTLAWSLLVLAGYFTMRHIINTPGMDYQMDKHAQLHAVASFHLTRAYCMQVFLAQNLLFILLSLWIPLYTRYKRWNENMPPVVLCVCTFILLSIITNVGNNAGRIVAILTPILCMEIAQALATLETLKRNSLLPMPAPAAITERL